MIVLLVVLHVIISFFLILVVLVQQGRGADLAGAFGGGGSQTAFGARGATTLLHKLTQYFFVAFVATSLTLAILQARPRGSVMSGRPAPVGCQISRSRSTVGNSASGVHSSTNRSSPSSTQYVRTERAWYKRRLVNRS